MRIAGGTMPLEGRAMPWTPLELRRAIIDFKVLARARTSVKATYGDWHQFQCLAVVSKPVAFYRLAYQMDADELIKAIELQDRGQILAWTQRYLVEGWFRCWIRGSTTPRDIMSEAQLLLDVADARLDLEGVRRRVKASKRT